MMNTALSSELEGMRNDLYRQVSRKKFKNILNSFGSLPVSFAKFLLKKTLTKPSFFDMIRYQLEKRDKVRLR